MREPFTLGELRSLLTDREGNPLPDSTLIHFEMYDPERPPGPGYSVAVVYVYPEGEAMLSLLPLPAIPQD